MTYFIEYTDPQANLKTLLNVSMICAVIQDEQGKACIVLNDRENTKLRAVETYDEIRKRIYCSEFPDVI